MSTLSHDVPYGRPIARIPWGTLIGPDIPSVGQLLPKQQQLLSLVCPLIAESRKPDSVHREWLDVVSREHLPALRFTDRQQRALEGTTVQRARKEMMELVDFIGASAPSCTSLHNQPVSWEEGAWALAVVERHAHLVEPALGTSGDDIGAWPRLLLPLVELLSVRRHPDPSLAGAFREETMGIEGASRQIVQRARRDMAAGDEVVTWAGRLSNSDAVLRFGATYLQNPTGVGGNISRPPNWSENQGTPNSREFRKYNCSSLDAFELRISPKGWPERTFVRCQRVALLLKSGWYSPRYIDRIQELNKWPPPKKYNQDDWLGWTQADREVNFMILEYCRRMRQQLKETITAATVDDFKNSPDPTDQLLWALRVEESRTFKECVALARSVSVDLPATG